MLQSVLRKKEGGEGRRGEREGREERERERERNINGGRNL